MTTPCAATSGRRDVHRHRQRCRHGRRASSSATTCGASRSPRPTIRRRSTIGASIACAGVCLTVVAVAPADDGGAVFDVEAAPETLGAHQRAGLAGRHAAQSGTGAAASATNSAATSSAAMSTAWRRSSAARISARRRGSPSRSPHELARFIAPKGSVSLDGTSLTVNGVDGDRFDCLLIPHTLKVTTWGERQTGDRVNLEVDTIARYVARLAAAGLDHRPASCRRPANGRRVRIFSSSKRASTTTSPTSSCDGAMAALDRRRRDLRAWSPCRVRSRFRRRSRWRSRSGKCLRRLRGARLRHPRRDHPLRHRRRRVGPRTHGPCGRVSPCRSATAS